jgi:hypothetical protein
LLFGYILPSLDLGFDRQVQEGAGNALLLQNERQEALIANLEGSLLETKVKSLHLPCGR